MDKSDALIMAKSVGENYNFPKEEEEILKLWNKIDAFKTSLKQSEGKPRYSFYDGPPFATGLPHYGHILAGTIKDIVTRYAHQSGFHVERRFGWDCHGLPVEFEIDQKLGIKGPEDVLKMGIDKYNAECRKIVMRYSEEWQFTVNRLGRWIDFENDYKTLYPWFMESVWWVFKQLFEKDMVYRGFRVMPYSTKCNTPLSNFEANQNYKEVNDPAVIISFPLEESPEVSMIAWTTTPWTLPSNLALVVNGNLDYVKVQDNTTSKIYIMMEARLAALFKNESEYTILERFKGSTLVGKRYNPLFKYFHNMKEKGAFQIFADDYVTDDSGTGVVHSAPAFGEDDYRVCMANGVIKKGAGLPCPVDASGVFTEEVADFKSQYVKDADKSIIKMLKQNGRLVHQSNIKHSYPFCWRSDTPLIYKAVPGWFVAVEGIVQKLLANNKKCYWVPEFVKEKRFHNWLENARDWNISRNRYWGTPIPLWVSDDFQEVICIGSIKELEELSGVKVTDLHRENVDGITIPSKTGRGVLRRVSEVFDCWFESGSMPYAQAHYPFENKEEFEKSFPADFIAEGIDQTRGWFYTLLVLSTALFDKPPFKNLIVNGLVLAADGAKMSKRKKNYPDPLSVVDKYGSDALRLYLINSPVVRADSLRFQETGVKDVIKDVFLPWYNAYRFLVQNIELIKKEHGLEFVFEEKKLQESNKYMDKWILSFTQSLLLFVKKEMSAYRLYTVVPRLVKFIDNLTNWYVRSNRKRLKSEFGPEDGDIALHTLFAVVLTMVKVMAPFTPFLTEHMYQNLKHFIVKDSSEDVNDDSVHYLMLPEPRVEFIHEEVERSVARMQTVIELGRVARDRKTLPIKYPLPEIIIIHKNPSYLSDVSSLERYISEELNVRQVTTSSDKEKYGLRLKAVADYQILGKRLKGDFKTVLNALEGIEESELKKYQEHGKIVVAGHELSGDDIKLNYTFGAHEELSHKYEPHSDGEVLVLLDITPDQTMLNEGIAREVVNRIQKLRKKAKLVPTDDITVVYEVGRLGSSQAEADAFDSLFKIVHSHVGYINESVKQVVVEAPGPKSLPEIIHEEMVVKGAKLSLWIYRGTESEQLNSSPNCDFVNLELRNVEPRLGAVGKKATVLLENPRGDFPLTMEQLRHQAAIIYGLHGMNIVLSSSPTLKPEISSTADMKQFHGKTLYVGPSKS